MYHYLSKIKNKVLLVCLLIVIRQGLGVLGAAINAFALTALVKLNFKEFLLQECYLLIVWTIIIAIEGGLKIYKIKTIQDFDIEIRKNIIGKFARSEYQEFQSRSIGTYLSWSNNDIELINQRGITQFFGIIQGLSGVVFSVIALLAYHWSLLVITLISVFIMLLIPKIFQSKVEIVGERATKQNELFVNETENILFGYGVLFNLNKVPLMAKKLIDASLELKKILIGQAKIESLVFSVGFFANIFFQIALTAYTGYLAFIGLVPIGTIEATGALNGVIFTSLGELTSQISSINSVKPIFKKHSQFKINDSNQIEVFDNEQEEIFRVENLGFGYDDKVIFNNLNFSIYRGKKYLVVGQSGSGKSTLFKLLFGYLKNYNGKITFNKKELTDFNRINIREHVLYVNQDPYLFDGTIRDNIKLDDQFSDDEILSVLKELGMILTIDELSTEVGKGGSLISGGQRQRIVLARGLIRKKKIIFMDEGTSAVDRETAIQIEQYLLLNSDLTVIIVTHNPHKELEALFDVIYHFPNSFMEKNDK